MKGEQIYQSEIVEIIVYSFMAFLLMGLVLVVFFYYSRKKIIINKLEKRDLEIYHQKLQLRAVILAQEEDRKRIAQDLHDDISSKLNVISLNCHILNMPNIDANEKKEISRNIIDLTSKALENARKIAHGLLPPVLERFGLHAGVEEFCAELASSKTVEIQYENKLEFDIKDIDRHLHVFRILQELANNSMRHGKATIISILFEERSGKKTCCYSDNGIGFDILDCKNLKGLGMKNIKSRVVLLDGTIVFESTINSGMSVIFDF